MIYSFSGVLIHRLRFSPFSQFTFSFIYPSMYPPKAQPTCNVSWVIAQCWGTLRDTVWAKQQGHCPHRVILVDLLTLYSSGHPCRSRSCQGLKTRSMIKFDKFQVCPTPPHPPTITTEKLSWQSFHQSWWRIWGTQNTQFCSQNTCSSKFSSFIQSFLCIFCSYRVQFYKTLWLQFLFSFPFLPIFNFSSIKNQSNVPFFFFFSF